MGEADLRLLEYNGSMGVLRRIFTAEGKDAENRTVRFRICEDFVMRRGPERLYMMDYTRRMREIFLGGTGCFSGGKIVLGISGDDALQSVTSPEGRFTAFVTTGDLWLADGNRNRCVRVFSFRSGTEPDLRCDYEKYRLRILECTDDGGLLFLAGGYMNRGEHEGETGLCLMRYDSTANTVTELTFIPCSMMNKLFEAASCEKMCMLVRGAEHVQSAVVDPEGYWDKVESFFRLVDPVIVEKRV